MKKEKIIEELRKHAYNFIANNYYNLELDQLKTICLESIYQLNDKQLKNMLQELEERL